MATVKMDWGGNKPAGKNNNRPTTGSSGATVKMDWSGNKYKSSRPTTRKAGSSLGTWFKGAAKAGGRELSTLADDVVSIPKFLSAFVTGKPTAPASYDEMRQGPTTPINKNKIAREYKKSLPYGEDPNALSVKAVQGAALIGAGPLIGKAVKYAPRAVPVGLGALGVANTANAIRTEGVNDAFQKHPLTRLMDIAGAGYGLRSVRPRVSEPRVLPTALTKKPEQLALPAPKARPMPAKTPEPNLGIPLRPRGQAPTVPLKALNPKAASGKDITKENLIEAFKAGKSGVKPEKLRPLADEARKYKSADEFVKGQAPSKDFITVYHRTNSPTDNFGTGGVYSKENRNEFFVSNKKIGQAEGYGKNVVELRVKKSDLSINDEFPSGEKHYTLSNNKVNDYLKTKSKLTDIYNQANQVSKSVTPKLITPETRPNLLPPELARTDVRAPLPIAKTVKSADAVTRENLIATFRDAQRAKKGLPPIAKTVTPEAVKPEPITPETVRPDVTEAINAANSPDEAGAIRLKNITLEGVAQKGRRLKSKFMPRSEQIGEVAHQTLLDKDKDISRVILDAQSIVGEKLTKPGVTEKLAKIFPYSTPERLQTKANMLRIIPGIGKFFGVSGKEQKLLFKMAESIKEIKNGEPVFGTLNKDGQVRYSAAEGKAMWEAARPELRAAAIEFSKPAHEVDTLFSRELRKQVFKITSDVEGWVHHTGFEGKPGTGFRKIFLNLRKAASSNRRTEAKGYSEDFEKAITKDLENRLATREYNKFVVKFEDALSQPITEKNPLKADWKAIKGKFGANADKDIQVPNAVYDDYIRYTETAAEASDAGRLLNTIGNYYKTNLLVHVGSSATNLAGQAILYSTKILDDFYGQALLGKNPKPLLNDVAALYRALMPSYVKKTPSYLWGEEAQVKAFIGAETSGLLSAPLRKILSVTFQPIDTYAKRVVYLSEAGNQLGAKGLKKANAKTLRNMEEGMIASIDKAIDQYALAYTNRPRGLTKFSEHPASFLAAPFPTYYYKFLQSTGHYFNALNPAAKMTVKDRTTRIMTLSTMLAAAHYISNRFEEKSGDYIGAEEGVTKGMDFQFQKTGRIKVGEKSGGEEYLRIAKYPWLNVYQGGKGLIELGMGDAIQKQQGGDRLGQLQEEAVTFGPGVKIFDTLTGRRSKYDQYKSAGTMAGEVAKTTIPLFRLTEGYKNIQDPQKRTPKNFGEAFSVGIPGLKLKGDKKTVGQTKRSPSEEKLKMYGGINIRTISPEGAAKERRKIIENIFYNIEQGNYNADEKRRAVDLLRASGVGLNRISGYLNSRKERMDKGRKSTSGSFSLPSLRLPSL